MPDTRDEVTRRTAAPPVCEGCGSPHLRERLRVAYATYYVCAACGLVFGVADAFRGGSAAPGRREEEP